MRFLVNLPEEVARQLQRYAIAQHQTPEQAIETLLARDLASLQVPGGPLSDAEAHAILDSLYGSLADCPIPEIRDDLLPESRDEL